MIPPLRALQEFQVGELNNKRRKLEVTLHNIACQETVLAYPTIMTFQTFSSLLSPDIHPPLSSHDFKGGTPQTQFQRVNHNW